MSTRFFRLINQESIFGEIEVVDSKEILVKRPFTVKNGAVLPYMQDELGESPKAVMVHPMNVLWSVPLDEFPTIEGIYNDATRIIISPHSNNIIV